MSRKTVSYTEEHIYEFTPDLEPIYTAADGESLTIETIDSLNGTIQENTARLQAMPEEVNAATGPVAVAGATPGDVLKADIEAIRVSEERGRVVIAPRFGLQRDAPDIEHPSTRMTPVGEEVIEFGDVSVPIQPVIGTIGVAPAADSYPTLVPHDHGGNLDTSDMTAGTTAYFPVFQEGAMLAMGDAKAAMADGEMCGTGAEIGTEIDVTLEVVSDPSVSLDRPLVETGEAWKTIASAETMEAAATLANRDMVALLAAEYGWAPTEAYMFSSLVGGLEISQVVDPLVTVRNAIPKAYLDDPFDAASVPRAPEPESLG